MSGMRELVVVSGKGGTGKTSLTAAFAALAEDKVLADTDVDAADLHLVLEPEILREGEFIGGVEARIVQEECTSCGKCLDLCRFGAIEPSFYVEGISCEGCGVCERFCPAGAIRLEEKVSGRWFVSRTRHGLMVHARLGMAEENSGKLVSRIRVMARELAEEEGLGTVIIDGPPGIGCPVIASVTGCSYALMITEPTLSGLHDLKRLARLTEHFDIPSGVCVNKFDINREMTSRIETWSRDRDIKLLGRISYDPAVTAAQIAGLSVVEHHRGRVTREVVDLWQGVLGELDRLSE